MGIGGIIGNALLGGVEGFGEGTAKEGEINLRDYNAQNHERLKQQLEADRSARDIALKAEADRALEKQKGHVVSPGATLKIEGAPDFTAPEKQKTVEERNLLTAQAEEANARARWLDREKDKTGKEPKPTMPKLFPIKDAEGNVVGVFDENSGSFGTPTPGTPAKESITHWFSKDEPAKPAVPAGLSWVDAAKRPIEGIHVFYPDMLGRGVGTAAGGSGAAGAQPIAAPDPLGLRASLPKKDQAPAAPAPAAQPPVAASATPATGIINRNTVLPYERGAAAERIAMQSTPPLLSGTSINADQVRAVLSKPRYDANDRLILESFKDSRELTPAERQKIASIIGA
jgi:hypothetical protein